MATTPMTIKVTGLKELAASCKSAAAGLSKELASINKDAAAALVPPSKVLAPRLTGRLAGSIRAGATGTAGFVQVGSASVPYAGPIHWGWPKHNIKPQPFLANALYANVDKIHEKYDRDLQAFLDRRF